MSTYSTQTVAQLKEVLKSRGLSTAGVKSDLVSRLEEADNATSAPAEAAPVSETPATAPEPVEEQKETLPAPPAEEEELLEIDDAAEKLEKPEKPEPAAVEPKKELTPEERKAAAIELITKRIARAKKFGSEEDVSQAEKDLARVEKFGVDLGTALAREIGLASSEGLQTKHRHNSKSKSRGGRGRGGFKNRR
jgi:SAP domain-containing ribonucleoprotein